MAQSPELFLISAVLRTHDMKSVVQQGIDESFFHAYDDEWAWIEKYFKRNMRVPSKGAFRSKFPNFSIRVVDDVTHFCDEVRANHIRMMLTTFMSEATDALRVNDLDAAMRVLSTGVVEAGGKMAGIGHDSDVLSNFEDVYVEVRERMSRVSEGGMAGIPTGFVTLDEQTSGWDAGDYIVIAGRQGAGKTFAMLKGATAAVDAGYTVQYFALEQSRAQITMRIHSYLSQAHNHVTFDNADLMKGRNFNLLEYKKFLRKMKREMTGKMHVSDTQRGKVTPNTVRAAIERNKPHIVYLDYITLMGGKGEGDYHGINKLSDEIKTVASEYQIPIVVAAQLNRNAVAGKEPSGTDHISGADGIGADADGVITMKRRSSHVQILKMAKYRHGEDGFKIWTEFNPGLGLFREITYDQAMDLVDRDHDEADAKGGE